MVYLLRLIDSRDRSRVTKPRPPAEKIWRVSSPSTILEQCSAERWAARQSSGDAGHAKAEGPNRDDELSRRGHHPIDDTARGRKPELITAVATAHRPRQRYIGRRRHRLQAFADAEMIKNVGWLWAEGQKAAVASLARARWLP